MSDPDHDATIGWNYKPETLLKRLKYFAEQTPSKVAYTYLSSGPYGGKVERQYTYQELQDGTTALATRLLASDIVPGDRVILVYPPSLEFIVAFLACCKAGFIAVPVYPPNPVQKGTLKMFTGIVEGCGAKVALTSEKYQHIKKLASIKDGFTKLAKISNNHKQQPKWPELQWLVTDQHNLHHSLFINPKLQIGKALREDVCFLQFTSGSTSEPKGVMISHGNLAHNLHIITRELKAGPDTVVVSWLPQYHDMGLIGSLLGVLYCGGSGYYMSPLTFLQRPMIWIEAVSKYRATHLQAPNFAYKLTARKCSETEGLDLSSVRHMINGAEPVDEHGMAQFYDAFSLFGLPKGVIYPTYGLAEHTVFVCSGGTQKLQVYKKKLEVDGLVEEISGDTANDVAEVRSVVGCGYPKRQNVDVRIVHAESCIELDEDCVGEIWIRSPSKALGYYNKPDLTHESFRAQIKAKELIHDEVIQETDKQEKKLDTQDDHASADQETDTARDNSPTETETQQNTYPNFDSKDTCSDDANMTTENHINSNNKKAESDTSTAGEVLPQIESAAGPEENKQHSEIELVSQSLTAQSDDPVSGYLRTGDLGFFHKGELFICGRLKDLIIVGGRNHYPQDIETTTEASSNLLRPGCCAAFSLDTRNKSDGGNEEVALIMELREVPKKTEIDTICGSLISKIQSSVKREHSLGISHFVLLEPRTVPKTTSGKIARNFCRMAYLDGTLKAVYEKHFVEEPEPNTQGLDSEQEQFKIPSSDTPYTAPNTQERPTQTVDPEDIRSLSNITLLKRLKDDISKMVQVPPDALDVEAPLISLMDSLTISQFKGMLDAQYATKISDEYLFRESTTTAKLVEVVKLGYAPDDGEAGANGESRSASSSNAVGGNAGGIAGAMGCPPGVCCTIL